MRRKQFELFEGAAVDYRRPIESSRTAMRRKAASPIARSLVKQGTLEKHAITTILDFGCGVGRDVLFYRASGFIASGYDPHEAFGWSKIPNEQFDFVSCLFVFNVIATPEERLVLGRRLRSLVR